jgi:uncharacterized protein YkwD
MRRLALLVVMGACSGSHRSSPASPEVETFPAGPDPVASEPAPPPPPARASAAPKGDAAAIVAAHNRVRAEHCAAPLAWSDELAAVAQKWANHLRDGGCLFEHSQTDYGENLAAGTDGALDADGVVAMWYGEIAKYDFRRGGFSMETGHFTQVVWRATTTIGCGTSRCNGMTIWVCNYDPAGNFEGAYRENVKPKGCR